MGIAKALEEANERGENWAVLPPDKDFKFPLIGSRLMHKEENGRWVFQMTGHHLVMERLKDQLNKEEKITRLPALPNPQPPILD